MSNPTCGSTPAGATGYTFDGNGQRTASTPATGTASSYGYDQAARLTTATTPTGSGSYTYNGLGQRVSKTVAGTTTGFVWDNAAVPNLLSDGTTRYLYGPDGSPIEQTGTAGTFFFVHDQIGSTRTPADRQRHRRRRLRLHPLRPAHAHRHRHHPAFSSPGNTPTPKPV